MLFKSNFKDLCYFAVQYVKDSDIAKDIVQEIFFGLWQKKESIDLSRSVKSYLTSAVRNKCLNYIRDHKKFTDTILESEDQFIKSIYKPHDRLIEEELKKKDAELTQRLLKEIHEVVNEYRKKENYAIIHDKQALVSYDEAIDITDKIIKLYDVVK